MDILEILKTNLLVWEKLNSSQQATLIGNSYIKEIKKGEQVVNPKSCEGFIIVVSGTLRVFLNTLEGKEITLFRLLEHDCCLFSASCVVNGFDIDAQIVAESDCEILLINPNSYRFVMQESSELANFTNELLANRMSEVMWLVDQIISKKLDTRLAAFLIEESIMHDSLELKLTHEEIANHLGSVREVITRMLKHFQNDHLIEVKRGKIIITDYDKLYDLAEVSLR